MKMETNRNQGLCTTNIHVDNKTQQLKDICTANIHKTGKSNARN